MDYLLTFCEGVITFLSPCLLPMLPVYLAYFAGGMDAATTDGEYASKRMRHTVVCALGFAVGLALVFATLGAFAGTFGILLMQHQRMLDVGCGALLVLLGLNYLGVVHLPALDRTLRSGSPVVPRGFVSSLLFGVAFALGWTPCVGTFLASALALAATAGGTLKGVALLLCYSAGLGLPFVLAAIAVDQLGAVLSWVRTHHAAIDRVAGAFLVAMGILMATGQLGIWLRMW